jgi:PilZ domain
MRMPPATEAAMEERRKVQRGRTLKAGSIVFNSAAGIDCRVRNMSASGACLEVTSQVGVPNDFVLVVGYDRFKQACHVIWRSDTRLGVEFRAP